ncbi:elongator complex protein 1 [Platysternon megacephalum]|uniref:Elongator complex protein 1 n=1 Tax=Platysternon megacephalum TaxID=55544 RepID=A0A4D9DS00_9SAUR|nr:elongator complex protein 1 [Platysternon megacephalum]
MVYGVESMLKKVEGTAETEETQEGRIFPTTPGIPMAPVNTSIVSYGPGSSHPPETRHEFKPYTPEQSRAMGKALAPPNRDTALDWLAKVNALSGISKEDAAALIRECMQ